MQNAMLSVGCELFKVTYCMVSERIGTISAGNREILLHIIITYAGQPAILHHTDDTSMPIHLMRGLMDHVHKLGPHWISFARRSD